MDKLVGEIEVYVEHLFNSYERPYLLYHNLYHTKQVVQHANKIADHYQPDQVSRFILLAAAWFHDTGQLTGDLTEHEETSVQFMGNFLTSKNIDRDILNEITRCILVTKMPVAPVYLLEKILCDSDTWHLGTEDFLHYDALVWREMELRFNTKIENKVEKSLQFLEVHQFYTEYCINKLSSGKKKNIELLKDLLK